MSDWTDNPTLRWQLKPNDLSYHPLRWPVAVESMDNPTNRWQLEPVEEAMNRRNKNRWWNFCLRALGPLVNSRLSKQRLTTALLFLLWRVKPIWFHGAKKMTQKKSCQRLKSKKMSTLLRAMAGPKSASARKGRPWTPKEDNVTKAVDSNKHTCWRKTMWRKEDNVTKAIYSNKYLSPVYLITGHGWTEVRLSPWKVVVDNWSGRLHVELWLNDKPLSIFHRPWLDIVRLSPWKTESDLPYSIFGRPWLDQGPPQPTKY